MRTFILRLRSTPADTGSEAVAGQVQEVATGRIASVRDDEDLLATVRSWMADDETPGG